MEIYGSKVYYMKRADDDVRGWKCMCWVMGG